MAPHSSILAGEFPWKGEPGGLPWSPWGLKDRSCDPKNSVQDPANTCLPSGFNTQAWRIRLRLQKCRGPRSLASGTNVELAGATPAGAWEVEAFCFCWPGPSQAGGQGARKLAASRPQLLHPLSCPEQCATNGGGGEGGESALARLLGLSSRMLGEAPDSL